MSTDFAQHRREYDLARGRGGIDELVAHPAVLDGQLMLVGDGEELIAVQ
jgi:hypothetical protein